MNFHGKETNKLPKFWGKLPKPNRLDCDQLFKHSENLDRHQKKYFLFLYYLDDDMICCHLSPHWVTFIQCPAKESWPLAMTLLTTAGCCWTETLQLNSCNFHCRLRQVTRLRQILKWVALVWKNGGPSCSSAGCILLHSHPLDLIIQIPTSRQQNQRWRAWPGTFRCLWNAWFRRWASAHSAQEK